MADQCGLGADGTLLDASQIQWYNDPDDDTPLIPAARRSTRTTRPAPKLVDPNNAITLRKCKASRPVVVSEGSEEESEGDRDNGVMTDAATDMDVHGITLSESESTYQQTKEMGNADRQVG